MLTLITLGSLTTGNIISIISAVILILLAIGGYLISTGVYRERVNNILALFTNLNKTVTNDLMPRFAIVESRVSDLWDDRTTVSSSPRVLNEKGKKILRESKIDELIKQHFDQILENVKEKNPSNAYRAETAIIEAVNNLFKDDECKNYLERAAFLTGENIETILFVGAIDVRDKVLDFLGFDPDDIDELMPKKNHNK